MAIFTGACTALITPFTNEGVDYDAFSRIIDEQIEQGIDALLICGTTGEPSTMTCAEHMAVIKFGIKYINHRVPVIAGTGSNCTLTAVRLAKEAEEAGADAILTVTPYYNKCTQKGLVAHFGAIAEAVKLPIILYNVPCRTGLNLLPSTLVELTKYDNIVAIKEASGDIVQVQAMYDLISNHIDIYSGEDSMIADIIKLGGKGVISVLSNIMPKVTHTLTTLCKDGTWEEAFAMQEQLNPLINQLFIETNPIPVKKAMEIMGFCGNVLRLPLTELEENHTVALEVLMKSHGLI